ncbi:PAS domain S-box-containing protein/diguanylate cyclase (GGDEF) domain-containing protein [Oryzisolibacter propanilivorax]|uniref:PAS domain S-box-containing protein/diguanylate cyclase (GGDEF) domain-containing protein n=1 Tax=Oryzisolibacter propanilivorax TaxID=1527607 RepID=A0A1G9PI08_9BURK|nr:EAL domain-containing protein [Oryzisolibacter propanilivorax]SDL98121.1 PAS domain S-box-containing protein/diguanylate cyclase (GGDEF) domain-containing protein [Oryzisolibacter propanilivorax]
MKPVRTLQHPAWLRLPGLAVAVAGLGISLALWQYQTEQTQALSHARFERQARAATQALQQRIESKADVLLSMRGVLMVNPQLSRAQFELVAGSLQLDVHHASVRNLHFTRAVPAAQRADFEAQARLDAHLDGSLPTGFAIHPALAQPEYFVVDYVWPLAGNEPVQGLEIHSQPANLESLLQARDTGNVVASAPFDIVQGQGTSATAFNIRLAVYAPLQGQPTPRFLGAIGAIVSVKELLHGMRQRGYLEGLAMTVHDLGTVARPGPPPGQPLYSEAPQPVDTPLLTHDITVDGRLWRTAYAPTQSFLTPQEARLPLVLTLGALAMTALLTAVVALLVRRRLQALAHAQLAARSARESETRFRTVFHQAAVGMAQVDSESGRLVRANQRFCDIVGYTPEQVRQLHVQDLTHPDDLERSETQLRRLLAGEIAEYRLEKRYRRQDGSLVWVDVTASAMRGQPGGAHHHILVVQDITQRRKAEEDLRYLAYNDPLTGLPNRRLLLDRLEQALATTMRHQSWGAVLLLDLDHFKTVNETRGHDAGDRLLRQATDRLRASLGGDVTLARQGGDEFVAVLKELSTSSEQASAHAEEVARDVLKALRPPFDLGGELHHITLSIGITLFDGKGEPAEELLKRSELAMYDAKAAGRDTLRFFDPRMQAVVAARAQLEADMRTGLAAGQFELYYQPKVGHGSIRGAEALLRWRHPARGFVPPSEFIAQAEQSGLILQLGQWVLEEACRQLAQWTGPPLLSQLSVAVNVSPRQFREAGFVAQVLQALAGSGADARRLRLELTEGMLLHDVEGTIDKMVQLRGYGVGFSLDDFGTGYSSLAYLKRLPLHELKIDQGFVRDVLTDPNDAAIARTIVALGTSLGLQVVAEGVETEAQRQFLEKNGCHVWQGYLLSPPLPRERFEALVQEHAAGQT